MASSHSLCTHQCYGSYNARTHFNSFKNATFPLPSSFKLHHMVYDLENKFNKLADEVDRDAGISRLTLFSSCKLRADGYHYLASLFHVIGLGDEIKFSLSPSKSTDRLSTNVSGVPLDERNLVHLDKKVHTGLDLVVAAVMLLLLCGQQINLVVVLLLKRISKSGLVRLALISPSFFSHGAAYCTGRVEDVSPPVPFDIPIVLIKPQEACPTAEVYKRLRLDQASQIDPLTLLDKISRNAISQEVCANDLEPPAFEVLPSLQRLKQRIAVAGRGQYDVIFMSGRFLQQYNICVGAQFVYDDDEYKHVFVSGKSLQ
ncbi:hypothetical protein DH2020_000863 [Rehmannia glutinosa]|uniref:Uncharacterized protein n=1 Tax=Rehmannia glutinosa TaxID=99300 RepID=A0ABR0XXT3_REHGL